MDVNNWRATQGQPQNNEAIQGMDPGDWRTPLQAESRQRIVNKIMETLKKHLPFSGPDGLAELNKIAVRFEEKTYAAATSQSDYLKKISLKMLTVETKSTQNPMANSSQSNSTSHSQTLQDPASQSMQSQLLNQVQPLPTSIVSNQSHVRQQLLSQNISNNITSSGAPNSVTLPSALPPGGMSQGTMPNVSGPNPNMQNIQNMSNVTTNAVGNSMGQGLPSNIFSNTQRQNPGRQQQVVPQEQLQQSQNSQQYLYNQQQIQNHLMKQKFQQGSSTQSLMQSQNVQQQQQQNLLQSTQVQSSQLAVMQPSLRQPTTSSTLQQSSQSMLQQQSQSLHMQHQQSQQSSTMHQQQNSMPQHSLLSTQQLQPQQLSGQQQNTANMQQNQLNGQQNGIIDVQQSHQQQQRSMPQQNSISNLHQQHAVNQQTNLANMHQQQSAAQQNNFLNIQPQNNLSGFQQQQMVGKHGNSGLQTGAQDLMLHQSKVSAQQQMQQNLTNSLSNQAQLSQPSQQHIMPQIQSHPGQMQQQLGLQQTVNPLPRDMQQRILPTGSLLQQAAMVPQTSLDSSSHAGNANGGDWQEEIYQKIKSMKERYSSDLHEMYQRLMGRFKQHGLPPNQLEKVKNFKTVVERIILFLRTNKHEVQPNSKEKIVLYEKQIINLLTSNRQRNSVSSMQQGQVPQSQMHALQQSHQSHPQISQSLTHENQMNIKVQPMNIQGSVATSQQNNVGNVQHNTSSSIANVLNSRQSMIDVLQPGSNLDPGQGNGNNSIQQVAINSVQQNPASGQQQMNMNLIASQGGLTTQQLQLNQYQQRKMQQQQHMQRQHFLQQHQTNPHQSAPQLVNPNQMNDTNDVKIRQQIGGKSGVIQQLHSSGQRPMYHQQQMKAGTPFSISSPQVLQAASPQIGHHSSPQLDQQNLLISHTKVGTPLQSANSPFVVSSPSTSMGRSPMPGDSEKLNFGASSLSNAGNNPQHPSNGPPGPSQSLAIGTPGISASPLLAEFANTDGCHGVASTIVSGNSNVVEQPLDRLLKVVKSMSPKALSASVSDISSVVSMVDRISGSAPGNGSRAAVGEDLAAMTKCHLQARSFISQDGLCGTKRMRRCTSAVPSSVVSSTGSVNDSIRHLNGCESDGESTGASTIKRPRFEAIQALEEELREINHRLIDTVVCISEDGIDPTAVAAAGEGGEGIIVKCSFNAVALSPNLKTQYKSAQMSPIQPLRMLIPSNYPNCSPILLDKFPVEVSKEYEDLWIKTKSRFNTSLRSLTQPMSLGEIAKTWGICARNVISEYAQKSGGGSFSSKYGTWENCLSAA